MEEGGLVWWVGGGLINYLQCGPIVIRGSLFLNQNTKLFPKCLFRFPEEEETFSCINSFRSSKCWELSVSSISILIEEEEGGRVVDSDIWILFDGCSDRFELCKIFVSLILN